MGPLASAEFLKTIYECNLASREQEMPRCIMYSDPGIPDRTEAIQRNLPGRVVTQLQHALTQLAHHNVAHIVVTCITSHYFLPHIGPELRDRVVSLIDLALDALIVAQVPHLMFCTNGTRQTGIFQRGSGWPQAAPFVVLPTDEDQHTIHELLYRVKQGDASPEQLTIVEQLLRKYQVKSLLAGFTEMHLITRHLLAQRSYHITDPLLIVARTLPQLLAVSGGVPLARESFTMKTQIKTA